jgi:hypothetical protein
MNPSAANETLKFQAGETYTIALQQLTGKPCTSRFTGDQLLYSLVPSAESPWLRMFVEPYVQDRIRSAGIAPGEYFQISKAESFAGNRRVVSMEVRKAGAVQRTPAPVVTQAVHTVAPHPTPAPQAPQPPPLPQMPVNGAGQSHADLYVECFREAVRIAPVLVEIAKGQGFVISPAFDDIRCIATHLSMSRSGR